VKRNQWVTVVVLAAFALMLWSGYANYKRRKQSAQHQLQGAIAPENANNQTVQQDVAADEGLPDLRGKRAPEFSLRTVEGKKLSLSDYKGKAVLINFWATWCAPCKIEMPWLVALRTKYAPQGFEILGVSEDDADTPRSKLAKFGQEEGLNYPLLVGDDAVSRKYGGVEFLPTSYFVGRDGKIVAETAGLVSKDEVEASIKKALAAGGK
jgi:peroxiredoxin